MGNLTLAVFDLDCQFLRQVHNFVLRTNKYFCALKYGIPRGLEKDMQMGIIFKIQLLKSIK